MDKQRVIRSAGLVSVFVLASRAFGLVRDMAMAAFFGSSLAMDAFVVAFTIPNLFRGLFGEGALSSAFVPVFTETLQKEGPPRVWRFAANMLTLLSSVLAGLVITGILVVAVWRYACPLSPRIALILDLLQIMLPYLLFICLAAFFSAMLNSLRRFALPAAVPVILNLVMLAVLLGLCPRLPVAGTVRITVVAWGVVLAGVLQWLVQLPSLWRVGFRFGWSFDWADARVRRVITLMGAAVIGMGVTQVNVVLDRFIAVFVGPGSPSYLYYAERLIYFPLGLFATALSIVLLPTFSGQAAQERPDLIRETLNHSLRQLMFIMLPAAAGLLVLAKPIVRLVYERGDFTALTTDMTTIALQCYAPGLLVFSLLKVLVPVFYAHQDIQTPVRIGILCTVINLALKLILMWPMKHAGIALATVLSSAVNVAILAWLVQRRIGSPGWRRIGLAFSRMLAVVVVMSVAAVAVQRGLMASVWLAGWADFARQLIALVAGMGVAVLVYAAGAALCRCPELVELWQAVRRRNPVSSPPATPTA